MKRDISKIVRVAVDKPDTIKMTISTGGKLKTLSLTISDLYILS